MDKAGTIVGPAVMDPQSTPPYLLGRKIRDQNSCFPHDGPYQPRYSNSHQARKEPKKSSLERAVPSTYYIVLLLLLVDHHSPTRR